MPDVLYSRKGDGMERGVRVGRWGERHCKVGFFIISSIFWNLQIHGLLIDRAYFLLGRLEEERRVDTIGSGRRGASAR